MLHKPLWSAVYTVAVSVTKTPGNRCHSAAVLKEVTSSVLTRRPLRPSKGHGGRYLNHETRGLGFGWLRNM